MRKKTRDTRGFFDAPTDYLAFAVSDTRGSRVPVSTVPDAFTLP